MLGDTLKRYKRISFTFLLAVIALLPLVAFSQAMESASYKIQFDSINVGGGNATSDNYILEDTTGEVATGESESASYKLHAGYQQMNEVFISITAAADVALSPDIGGITGGTSNGSTAVTVTTDSRAGYELSIKASSTPAMQRNLGGDSIGDYTPAGAAPDFAFSVAASDAELGFTPEGTDIAQRYRDDGGSCNTDTGDTADACWDGLSTSDVVIANRTSANHTSGTETTVKFRVELGSSATRTAGVYTATTTLTALAL